MDEAGASIRELIERSGGDIAVAAEAGSGSSFGPVRGVLLELLEALDEAAAGSPQAFYDRICRGVCELTEITRCAVLLYDEREKRVMPAGSHGIDEDLVGRLHGTLDETPIAAKALSEDRVIVTSALAGAIPERHRRLPGVGMLACVPVAAGTRWLGIMLCDTDGSSFELDPAHQDLLWALGKVAALAAGTQISFTQHERSKLLSERVALAREVHDRVMQRLFGLSLVLGSEQALGPEEQRRASEELHSALDDLRAAMQRNTESVLPPPSPTLAAEVRRLRSHYPETEIDRSGLSADPPENFEALAQSVLAEALHNATKHAQDPRIEIASGEEQGTFVLEIRNDGARVRPSHPGQGLGLKLAALDALQSGGVLEFGRFEPAGWRVRLVLPLDDRPVDG